MNKKERLAYMKAWLCKRENSLMPHIPVNFDVDDYLMDIEKEIIIRNYN